MKEKEIRGDEGERGRDRGREGGRGERHAEGRVKIKSKTSIKKKKLSTTGWSSIKLGGLKSISYFRS